MLIPSVLEDLHIRLLSGPRIWIFLKRTYSVNPEMHKANEM